MDDGIGPVTPVLLERAWHVRAATAGVARQCSFRDGGCIVWLTSDGCASFAMHVAAAATVWFGVSTGAGVCLASLVAAWLYTREQETAPVAALAAAPTAPVAVPAAGLADMPSREEPHA